MKNLKFAISVIAIFFFVTSQFFAEISIDGKDLNDKMPVDPKVKIGQLDNGLVYYIRENNKPENRAELQILIKAGSILETDAQAGLAHFLEHMCFNGTKNFPKDSLVSFLEATGMRFGADVNANTGFDRTYYMLTIPMDKPELLNQGFQVLEDWLHNVTLANEEIEKERGVIMEEWRLYKGAQQRIQRKHFPNLLYGSKYAERLPIGDTAVIQNAPREEFVKFYTDWYRPNLTAVIAVGDFDAALIEKKIIDHFQNVENPNNAPERKEYKIGSHDKAIVSIATDKELTYPSISLYFKKDKPDNAGTYNAYLEGIKNSLFSTMLSQRLQEKTTEANPPYMFAQAAISSFIANKDAFFLVAVPQGDILKSTNVLLEEAYRVKQHGFTKAELERAKEQLMSFIEGAHKEKDKTESKTYAMEYYRNFIEDEGIPGIDYELMLYKEFLPQITLDDVNALIDGLIREQDLVITVSDKADSPNTPTEDQIMALYNDVKNKKLEPYQEDDISQPLLPEKPTPGTIVSEDMNEDLGIKTLELSNGAKVMLKKTDFKNDEVLMRAYSPGGHSLADKSLYISAANADAIIDEAGIGKFSSTNLQKKLAGKNLRISPYIGELTEGFSGMTSPDDMETFFQVMYLYFTSPRKDEESFQSFVQKTVEAIENSKDSPEQAFRDTINAVLGNYHYRSMPVEADDIKSIDLNKAYEFYKQRFSNAGDFNFVFVGNFDEALIKDYIKTYIASLPGTDVEEEWKDVGKRYPKGKIEKTVKAGIEQKSSVRIAITGDFEYEREERFELQSMIEVLRIRLREVIREDKGGVYGIGAYAGYDEFPEENYIIQIVFGTSPDKVEDLVSTVYSIIEEIKAGKFSEEYVSKVKEILSREYETSIKENRYWLSTIYNYSFHNEPLNQILEYPEYVKDIDKDMIVETANEYLNMDNLIEIIQYPED